jgi:hypothetical protein
MRSDVPLIHKKWWEYTGNLKFLNGGDEEVRYVLVEDTSAWANQPVEVRRAEPNPRPKMSIVLEVADDINHILGNDTEKWRALGEFRIWRYLSRIRGTDDDKQTYKLFIESGLPMFGQWNECEQPKEFDDDDLQDKWAVVFWDQPPGTECGVCGEVHNAE